MCVAAQVGFPVMGIWARGMSSSQINYCYRSNNGKWVRDTAI